VLTWSQRPVLHSPADLYRGSPHTLYNVIADQSYRVIARVPARGHGVRTDLHDFVITKRGTALLLGFRYMKKDLSSVGGPKSGGTVIDCLVQEIDLTTNKLLFNWSAIRHVPITDSYAPVTPGWDYFHVNSLSEDSDGNLLVSARHTSAVYKIDRHSGRIIWQLGGRRSTFKLGPGAGFRFQHDAQRAPDGTLTMFDNDASEFDKSPKPARALSLRFNARTKTVNVARQFVGPQPVVTISQGSARVLPNGNMFVGWGNAPSFSEFAPDGRLLFSGSMAGPRFQSYRAFKYPWVGRPPGAPAMAASSAAGATTVYAAWNGATEIANWRVLGGSSADSLAPLGTVAWNGLETQMRATPAQQFVSVEALDASGKVIGVSAVIEPKVG
jgi:hypothetical protein